MKKFLLLVFFLILSFISNQVSAKITLSSWECQFSENGESSKEWISSVRGNECYKGKGAGYIFYRAKFLIDMDRNATELSASIFLDTIGEADEAYVEKKLIGKTGGFPPTYLNSMHRPRMYYLGNTKDLNGRELLLKVYSEFPVNRGLELSKIKVGLHSEISKILFWEDFKSTTSLPLVLTLFLITTFFILFIYIQKAHQNIHLWAAATSMFMATYTFFLSRYGYEMNFSNLINYRALVSSAMMITICLASFSYCLSKSRASKSLLSLAVLNFIYLIYIQFFNSILQYREAYKNWFLLFIIIVMVMIYHFVSLVRKNSRARFMLAGTVLFFCVALNDITITLGLRSGVNLAHYGLAIFAITFLLSEVYELFSEIKISALVQAEKTIRNQSKIEAIIDISKQVSHDIRSPLAALNTITSSLDNVPEDKRILIRNSVQRINDIANNLLNKSIKPSNLESDSQSSLSIELISPIVDGIISEKRTQLRERSQVDISINLDKAYGLFAKINPTELKRVISNMINNAVEAADLNKPIAINVKVQCFDTENLAIIVKDNGRGISPNILSKLGEKGVTEGKENSNSGLNSGSGLGVYHAKKTIESFGGKLIIESETLNTPMKGSTFSIILPISETPKWFVQELIIDSQKTIISLDDDISIHQIWTGRLQSLVHNDDKKIEHLIFSSGEEFLKIAPRLIGNANLFLVDLELLGQSRTGLDVIEELSLTHPEIIKKTILVTSRFEEVHVRERCARLDIKLIPKAMAGFVPMKLQEARAVITNQYDAVLLDDDELVRMTWAYHAKKNSKKLKIYINAHELLSDLDQFDKRTHFFVDSNLGKDIDGAEIKGEVILEHLYKNGFTELFLCTGHESENFAHLKFIKNVFSKTPPF